MSINPSTPEPLNRCVRIKRNGERCKRLANNGTTVCNSHGARAPQIRAKAQTRLLMSQDKLMGALLAIALDKKLPVQHRLVAIRDGLDRANLGAKTQIELDVVTDRPKTFEELAASALVDVAQTDDGDWFVQYGDGTHKIVPAGSISQGVGSVDILNDLDTSDDPNVIDAEVVEDDDHSPLVPRDADFEPPAQTRSGRAFEAEVARENRGRERERAGGDERSAALRAEREALGMTTPRHASEPGRRRAGGHSDNVAAMNAQQDEEDAVFQRVKDAERRQAEQARAGRRARSSEASMTDGVRKRRA